MKRWPSVRAAMIGLWSVLAYKDTSSSPPALVPIPGQLAFVTDRVLSQEDIYLMRADGSVQRLTTSLGQDDWPAWSPNGQKIVFESERDSPGGVNFDVFTMNADGTGLTPLTADPVFDGQPAWSPDGTKIAFVSTRDAGNAHIFTMTSWSPDSAHIAFDSNADIYIIRADGTGLLRVTQGGSTNIMARWRPGVGGGGAGAPLSAARSGCR